MDGKREPLVSVIIPAYNAGRTIQRAIQSALGQSYPCVEVIVVDDGSEDDTAQVVEFVPDRRIRLIRAERNRGPAPARNLGIRSAGGEYLAFLDADDEWLPDKLAKQVRRMEANRDLTLVSCDCLLLSESGETMRRFHERYQPVSGTDAWKTMLRYNFVTTPTVLARRRDLLACGGFDEKLRVGEDQDLWIRLATRGPVEVLSDVLVKVHDQPRGIMHQYAWQESEFLLKIVEKHLRALLPRLSPAEVRAIRGQRCFYCAANLYAAGVYSESARLFCWAGRWGYRPVRAFLNVPRAFLRGLFCGNGASLPSREHAEVL